MNLKRYKSHQSILNAGTFLVKGLRKACLQSITMNLSILDERHLTFGKRWEPYQNGAHRDKRLSCLGRA